MGEFPGVIEANVYGVLVPNHEGRAGCAAIQLSPEVKDNFDFQALARHARAKLPRYAVPVFIRVVQNPSHINNNKQQKGPLREEGVDPTKVGSRVSEGKSDRFLWLAPGNEGYVEFGKENWDALVAGGAKL
jgi:acyl-CoA synthetase (AMP-forming)/AMP-acid ligase II